MFQINCLNPISKVGLDRLTADYKVTDNMNDAEGVLVRSASMHELELPENLLAGEWKFSFKKFLYDGNTDKIPRKMYTKWFDCDKIKDTPAATANLKVVLFLSSLILLIIFLLTYCRNGFLRLSHPTVVAGPCPGKSFVSSGKTRILSLIEFKICL